MQPKIYENGRKPRRTFLNFFGDFAVAFTVRSLAGELSSSLIPQIPFPSPWKQYPPNRFLLLRQIPNSISKQILNCFTSVMDSMMPSPGRYLESSHDPSNSSLAPLFIDGYPANPVVSSPLPKVVQTRNLSSPQTIDSENHFRTSFQGNCMTEENRQAYRKLLLTTPGLGEYISGAILFEETIYQSTKDGKKFVDCFRDANIVLGIKVDKGLSPLPGSNNESWCQGLDGLASRSAEYYKQGARLAKWTMVSVPCGPSALAVKEAAWGLAHYAAISQENGLVPIVEPEILVDGDHKIERTLEMAEKVWSEVFFFKII